MGLHYIVCKNITDVFRTEKALNAAGISVRMVPAPPKEAGPCTTVLEVRPAHLGQAQKVMLQAGIPLVKVIEADSGRNQVLCRLAVAPSGNLFDQALSRVLGGEAPALEDLRVLLGADGSDRKKLWAAADNVRQQAIGDVIDVRAALEFSNYCGRNCLYCGLRSANKALPRYRMTGKEILREACGIADLGIRTVILQSGEDAWFTRAKLTEIIQSIKSETGLKITLSLGERNFGDYLAFREAGADNYLLKVETTDSRIYERMHPSFRLSDRKNHIRKIRSAGYITGSGNIIGLPGQDLDSIAKDIIWFWQEGIHMIGIGPFIPAPATPLETHTPGYVDMSLNAVAVTRLVCRNAYIPSTTALATLDKRAQQQGLACGANTVMLIKTPPELREKYAIYGNKLMVDLGWTLEMIRSLGRQQPGNLKLEVSEVGRFD